MRRTLALAAVAAALATVAHAHSTARLNVVSPADGARLTGGSVRVHVVGEGGDAATPFRLDLDGQPVDATGKVGGLFTTLSVAPNQQVVLDVQVGEGEHTLKFTPTFDPDAQQETVVRRFTVGPPEKGSAMLLVLVGLAVLGALGGAVALRRKA